MTAPQWVFAFGDGASEGDPARSDLLGGKGASLAAMSRAGFPVPPGFTISAECCAFAEANGGRWPDGLEWQVRAAMARLEASTGRAFGRGQRPLFVAVRSGAGVSMPGMMDTILNCGIASVIARSLRGARPDRDDAADDRDAATFKDLADHVRMFAASVAGLNLEMPARVAVVPSVELRSLRVDSDATPPAPPSEGGEPEWGSIARFWIDEYQSRTGRAFPLDPWDALTQCINAVFASWNSERAQAYRRHHNVRKLPGTAVTVQMMFPSERSGVLFTADPQNPDAGAMILEASWGLGEAVVSGAVTPDIYVIDRELLTLRNAIPGDRPRDQPALSEDEVQELARLGQRVEQHFGVPSDIEWGIADGRMALLQTRPIRGLDVLRAAEDVRRSEIARLRAIASSRHVVWVTHNLGETLSQPTPLTWDIARWFMSGEGGFGRMYRLLGFSPSREVDERGFLELICGRIYVDPVRAAGLFWGALPFEYDPQAILADRQTLERPPTKMNFAEADPFLFAKLPWLVWQMLRSGRTMRRFRAARSRRGGLNPPYGTQVPARDRFESGALPSLERYLQTTSLSLSSRSTRELLAELDRRIEFVLGDFAAESLLPGFFGGIAREELERWLVQILGTERGAELTGRLTTGLEGDVTIEQNVELSEAAQRGDLSAFLRRFGHRSAQEMELSQPRWSEDATFLERMVAQFRSGNGASPAERHAQQVAVRRGAEAELPRVLEENGASSLRERIETLAVEAQALLPYREIGKFHLMCGYATIRAVLVELGERWNLGRDVFFLERSELPEFEQRSDELRESVARRKREWQGAQKLVMGDVVDSQQLDELGRAARRSAPSAGRFVARPIAPGHAGGPARIVRSPGEADNLGTGYVLVCSSTDPGWTPLFLHCKGLIVERGGILSHGAIVARDFGIPAVVLENATQVIPDGAAVEIDAHGGSVSIAQKTPSTGLAPVGSG